MKNSISASVLIFSLCLFFFNTNASKSCVLHSDSTVCLEIYGKLLNLNKSKNEIYKVELISCNLIVEEMVLKNNQHFQFSLKKNTHYGIRISKKGFVSRLISIYTSVPKESDGIFRFQFDTELIEKNASKKLNADALDFPIAVISFNEEMKCFYYSEEYTSNIKRQLYLDKNF